MRRLFPYAALLAIAALSGGCMCSDVQQYTQVTPMMGPLSEANLSHQGISCASLDKIPGLNMQQTWERDFQKFDRVSTPGPGFCNLTKIGNVSPEEAKEWTRFIGTYMGFYGVANWSGPNMCESAQFEMAGMKVLDDGSLRIVSDRTLWDYPNNPSNPHWNCAMFTAGYTGRRWGAGAPENTILGDEVSGWLTPHWQNTAPIAPWSVAIDRDPARISWQQYPDWFRNQVAWNHDETNPLENCNWCVTNVYALNFRAYEYGLTSAAIKGSAGLAEFFNGEPMEINHAGFTVTVSGERTDEGWTRVSLHKIAYNGSEFTPSEPITHLRRGFHQAVYNVAAQRPQYIDMANWALSSGALENPIDLSGFIPELGVNGPPVTMRPIPDAIRAWVNKWTSGIDPRQRGGLR